MSLARTRLSGIAWRAVGASRQKETRTLNLVFPYYNSSLYAVWRAARCELDVSEVQPYWSHMCQSLDHMHRHNVCHRDLWLPIMLLSFKDNTVGVADFGLTRNCFPMEAPTTWQP